MAKKATDDKREPKPNALTIRASAEWREWINDYAKKRRTNQAGLIDLALAEMAERDGFRSPPER